MTYPFAAKCFAMKTALVLLFFGILLASTHGCLAQTAGSGRDRSRSDQTLDQESGSEALKPRNAKPMEVPLQRNALSDTAWQLQLANGRGIPRFGEQLFTGAFASPGPAADPGRPIVPGDLIVVGVAGLMGSTMGRSKDKDGAALALTGGGGNGGITATVDAQGNIFVPEIGTVAVAGVPANAVVGRIKAKAAEIFTIPLDIYAQPLGAVGVGVYVTGGVKRPGMYPGAPGESPLHYLDRAGGIDPERGSYRHVTVLRNGKTVATYDLYQFLFTGHLPKLVLERGDTILVGETGPLIVANDLGAPALRYEMLPRPGNNGIAGANLVELVHPSSAITRVIVTGLRGGATLASTVKLADFAGFNLQNGDIVNYVADAPVQDVRVTVEGGLTPSVLALRRGATLGEALDRIEVDRAFSNIEAVQLRRPGVAAEQKKQINDSLDRLEAVILNHSSNTAEEATIRAGDAALMERFIQRARSVQPKGIIVVAGSPDRDSLPLQDGDVIIIPARSGVVSVHGEVNASGAFAWKASATASTYIDLSGGLTANADRDKVLVAKADGRVIPAGKAVVGPGDDVIVLPKPPSYNYTIARDAFTAVYQLAVATGVLLRL
jgi:protein involved in polysaccharide export with SLBB domain